MPIPVIFKLQDAAAAMNEQEVKAIEAAKRK
jgi:hypothetical protein